MKNKINAKAPEFAPFIEWFERRGLRVYETQSSFWYCHDLASFAVQAIPWHLEISPSKEELQHLLTANRLLAARYSTSQNAPLGALSYHVMFSGSPFDISSVHASQRGKVRAGLRACQVKQISLDRYARESWELQADTMSRQGQRDRITEKAWTITCQSAIGLAGFEAWGAEVDGKLGAAILLCTLGDTAVMIYQQSLRMYLPKKINNALIFEVTKSLASRPGLEKIHYGLHSLDASPNLDRFKFGMGYRPYIVRQRVVFSPLVSPLAGKFTHNVVRVLKRVMPGNARLAKAEGILNFYIQGLKPAAQQLWPDVVLECKLVPDLLKRCHPRNSLLAKTEGMLSCDRVQQNLSQQKEG
jgi:hypothetical protein